MIEIAMAIFFAVNVIATLALFKYISHYQIQIEVLKNKQKNLNNEKDTYKKWQEETKLKYEEYLNTKKGVQEVLDRIYEVFPKAYKK